MRCEHVVHTQRQSNGAAQARSDVAHGNSQSVAGVGAWYDAVDQHAASWPQRHYLAGNRQPLAVTMSENVAAGVTPRIRRAVLCENEG